MLLYTIVSLLPSTYFASITSPLGSNASPTEYAVFGIVVTSIEATSFSGVTGVVGSVPLIITPIFVVFPLYAISTSQLASIFVGLNENSNSLPRYAISAVLLLSYLAVITRFLGSNGSPLSYNVFGYVFTNIDSSVLVKSSGFGFVPVDTVTGNFTVLPLYVITTSVSSFITVGLNENDDSLPT